MWEVGALHAVQTLPAMARAQAAGFAVWTPKLVERRRRPRGRGMMTVELPASVGYLLLPDVSISSGCATGSAPGIRSL